MGAIEDRNTKTHVAGGASAIPTPANNVTGNSNSSNNNSSSIKNSTGYQGPGHTSVLNPAESSGSFLGLRNQKDAAEAHTASRVAECGGYVDEELQNNSASLKGTCETEDHSFMGRKPGSEDSLGSSLLKGAMDRLTK